MTPKEPLPTTRVFQWNLARLRGPRRSATSAALNSPALVQHIFVEGRANDRAWDRAHPIDLKPVVLSNESYFRYSNKYLVKRNGRCSA